MEEKSASSCSSVSASSTEIASVSTDNENGVDKKKEKPSIIQTLRKKASKTLNSAAAKKEQQQTNGTKAVKEEEAEDQKETSAPAPKSEPGKLNKKERKPTTGANKTKKKQSKAHDTSTGSLKITDFFPVRRSERKTEAELKKEKEDEVESAILSGKQEGLEVVEFPLKGRGVIATRRFRRGEFVVEYKGDLIDRRTAKEREAEYEEKPDIGCYMYYFEHKSKQYCVDATAETGHLGRLVNHSAKKPNLTTKTVDVKKWKEPRLILVAAREIKEGEELLYDYGERNKQAVEANPWLTKS